MRVHRLSLEAFGPFADAVDIDLDDLTSTGLFLIHGPTGAGKTSLLDAIAYALYADVPGSRSKKGLRSDHAPRDRVPRVELEFTAGGRRLRIRRSPEFVRPKLRGSGTVSVPAKVTLEEHRGGEWVAVSARHDEVAEEVHDLLGMGLTQFAKVVVLPQGDFAAFLRASAEDRRELLERLFDITAFADVEVWLAERRRTSAAAAENAEKEVTGLLTRIDDAAAHAIGPEAGHGSERGDDGGLVVGHDPSAVASASAESPSVGSESTQSASVGTASFVSASAESADTLSDRLGALLAGADHDVTATLALADAAALADRRAAEALAAAVRRHDHRDRGERARDQLAVLTAGHAIQESRRSQLDAARRAQRVSGHVVAWRRALASVVSAEQAMAHTEPRLTAAALPSTAADLDTAAQRVHALDDVAHELVSLQRRRDSLESRLGAARAEEARLTDRVRVGTARVAELTEHERRAREQWAEATRTAPDVESARGALRHVAELSALCDLVAEDEAEVARLRDGLRVVRDEALTARSRHLDLRERHLDGMAAELAAGLHDGQPCPVCGSEEHPHLAASADPVRREDLAHAERLALAAAATVTETEVALAGVVARAAERRSHLGDTDRATLDLRRARAEDDLAHAESAAIALAEDAAALDAMTAALVGEQTALQTVEIEAAASSGTVATIAAELERIAQEEQTRRGEHAACPCRADDTSDAAITTDDLAHHDAIGRLIRLALQAHASLAQARAQASSIEQEMLTALRDEGFDTVAAAESARLTADEMAAVEQSLARHDADLASAQAVLADPDVEAALAGAVDDLDALREAESTTRRALLAVTRSQSSAQARLEMLGRLVPTAVDAAQRRDRLAREALRVRDLADTVGGLGPGNARRMRLTAYVLAARLERVVAFANDRLAVLGSGRYLLEHTDEKVGATRSGLGLRVLDQWTGQARDTSSLSGGETFMASLALALGLADAVRAESGGHDLGTLFVDEGFGSLDDESLEEVMAVLDGLQDGGRTVGVVSHVADLRARIPRQLRVRKTPDGSFVSVSPAHPAVAAS